MSDLCAAAQLDLKPCYNVLFIILARSIDLVGQCVVPYLIRIVGVRDGWRGLRLVHTSVVLQRVVELEAVFNTINGLRGG